MVDTSVTPTETHSFTYDDSYRVASTTQGPRGALSYTYTPEDRVQTMAVQSGPTQTFSYYPDGSLDTITWSVVSGNFKYTYTPAGQYQEITFPNGQHRDYAYDDQGRLDPFRTPSAPRPSRASPTATITTGPREAIRCWGRGRR